MADASVLNIQIEDGKGKTANMKINSEVFDQADLEASKTYESWADNVLQDLRGNLKGAIRKAWWNIPVTLDFGPDTPDPDSDIEEGAHFIFLTAGGYTTKIRIPTFDEALLIAGSRLVDLAAPSVADFVNTIIDGADAIAGVLEDRMDATDKRGDDIVALKSAYEYFFRSRGAPK